MFHQTLCFEILLSPQGGINGYIHEAENPNSSPCKVTQRTVLLLWTGSGSGSGLAPRTSEASSGPCHGAGPTSGTRAGARLLAGRFRPRWDEEPQCMAAHCFLVQTVKTLYVQEELNRNVLSRSQDVCQWLVHCGAVVVSHTEEAVWAEPRAPAPEARRTEVYQ